MRLTLLMILLTLFLASCKMLTLDAQKELTIKPSEQSTEIKSTAKTECFDYFFVYKCYLYLDLEEVK